MAEDIDKVLQAVNQYSATTISQIKGIPEAQLMRMISGQLRTTIKAHGPITMEQIGSASKRIATQLLAVL